MFDIIAGIFNFIKNLFWVASRKPGSSWLLGNVRPIDAKAAIILLILLGAVIGGGVVWYVARRRRAAAILQTLAAGYSSFSFWLKDGGALYIDGVKGDHAINSFLVSLLYTPFYIQVALTSANLLRSPSY
jgi:hypothetical protein